MEHVAVISKEVANNNVVGATILFPYRKSVLFKYAQCYIITIVFYAQKVLNENIDKEKNVDKRNRNANKSAKIKKIT